MAQINAFVGDLEHNRAEILAYINKACDLGADIVSFPELSITGYPPEDLVLKPRFVKDNIAQVSEIASAMPDNIVAVVGFVDSVEEKLYNSAAVLFEGKIRAIYHKKHLPNYGVFDEKRYFEPGEGYVVFELSGVNVGVNVCEDIWFTDPTKTLVDFGGAELMVNINSSPYSIDKLPKRKENLEQRSKENSVFVAYNNMAGGQDELVFDGAAMLFAPSGELIAQGKSFEEDLIINDLQFPETKKQPKPVPAEIAKQFTTFSINISGEKKSIELSTVCAQLNREEAIYKALLLGVGDYVSKNKFQKALIAVSGGIDSALCLTVAADALGSENLQALYLPSAFSRNESQEDALALAKNLNVSIKEISIEDLFQKYLEELKLHFEGTSFGAAEENIQARIRGNIAMAFSNKFGYLVLSTGNKSEFSVGYATLYGDMAGGFSILKDVYKTEVYRLAKYRNTISPVIPERILTKAPSAELRPNQKDQDTLPPYELLDKILKLYVEEFKTASEIVATGFPKPEVIRAVCMVDASEYKRRQAPPGIKVTPRAFGRDRRMPITQGYLGKK